MRIIEGFTLREVMGKPTIVGEGVQQIDFNKLITLNNAAAYLWQSVEGKDFTEEDLAKLLVEYYDVDYATALSDVTDVIGEWLKLGLIDR